MPFPHFPDVERSMAKGLASGVGWLMLSLRDLPFPFMKSILAGKLIAWRIELALTLREWFGVVVLDREAAVGAAKPAPASLSFDETLALRLGGLEDGLDDGSEVLKYVCLEASVGDVGDVTGVVDAMVPPTPILSDGETNFSFPVIEQTVGGTAGTALISAGL